MERRPRASLVIAVSLCAVQWAGAADTIVVGASGMDPNGPAGVHRVYAQYNGSSYDDIIVELWGRNLDANAPYAILGYQIAMDDAAPNADCAGSVDWMPDSALIDESHPDWFHAGQDGFTSVAAGEGAPFAILVSARLFGQPAYPRLDASAKYLGSLRYSIQRGSGGTWLVHPICRISDGCVHGNTCARSGTRCTEDEDCPRYAFLDDMTDTCEPGLLSDDGTFLHAADSGLPDPRIDVEVEALEIIIPVGACCDGAVCLGDMTAEDCHAASGVWDPSRACGIDPCPCEGVDCTHLTSECGIGRCNPTSDQCYIDAVLEGDPCTISDAEGVCMNGSCFVSSPCDTHVDCVLHDNNVCTWNHCGGAVPGVCDAPVLVVYGDVCGDVPSATPNGAVDLTDVLCALGAFGMGNLHHCPNADVAVAKPSDCPQGNGLVDLTDILKIIRAVGAPTSASATFHCDCPSNP